MTVRMLKWMLIIALVIIIIGIVIGIGFGRLPDASSWFRCRFNGGASYCRPSTRVLPRTPRIEELQPPAAQQLGVAALPAALPPALPASRAAARHARPGRPRRRAPRTLGRLAGPHCAVHRRRSARRRR